MGAVNMIEVKGLTKTFKSKGGDLIRALDNVSLTLPSKGFVFIVGKSGSGKTTLLNMLAATDSYDSGEILFNGISLNSLKGSSLDYYRNENIGFIFQDYELLDELTVYENVRLALDFLSTSDDTIISNAINEVGLSGFENRFPAELSGGEKQRVAIARAIVKNPAIILADEPTGNLDTITSREILELLKKISEKRLVLTVTHNIADAHELGSFIIELSYGRLIASYKRNDQINKEIEVKNNTLRLPLHRKLKGNIDNYIEDINNNSINDIIQDDLDFLPCKLNKNERVDKKEIKGSHISFKNAFSLGGRLLRRSISTIIFYSLIIAALFGIIYSSEIIISTDTIESKAETTANYQGDLISLTEEYTVNYSFGERALVYLDNDAIAELKNKGYSGKVYPSYSIFNSFIRDTFPNFGSSGVKLVDMDYFKYYLDKLELIYENDSYRRDGVYVTDFIIDMFNATYPSKKFSYNDIANISKYFFIPYVNGVINTHFKDKYPDVYECIIRYYKGNNDIRIFDSIAKKRMNEFLYDYEFYRNSYSLENNFMDYLIEANDLIYASNFITYCHNAKELHSNNPVYAFSSLGFNGICLSMYEALTGSKLKLSGFKPQRLDKPLGVRLRLPKSKGSFSLKEVNIEFTHVFYDNTFGYSSMLIDKGDKELCNFLMPLRSVTLENSESTRAIIRNNFKSLTLPSYLISIISVHDRLIPIFNKIFKLVIILLFIATGIALVFYSSYIVKKNIRTIGILKALGGRSKDILASLSLNVIITSITAGIMSVGFSYLFLFIIEKILLGAYTSATLEFVHNYGISYLLNNNILIIANVAIIIILLISSLLLIYIRLNKFKPRELIKGVR